MGLTELLAILQFLDLEKVKKTMEKRGSFSAELAAVMPDSAIHHLAKVKSESNQSKMANCSAQLSFSPENEFVELLWENGQIVMQGQSSRTRKSSASAISLFDAPKVQGKGDEEDAVLPKPGKYGILESVINDFSSSGPSGHPGPVQDDEMVHWLNYPIDDYSEIFPELSEVDLNPLSAQNNTALVDKHSSYGQMSRDSHVVSVFDGNQEHKNTSRTAGGGLEFGRSRSSQVPLLQQHLVSASNIRSRVPDFTITNNVNSRQASCVNPIQASVSPGVSGPKMRKKDTTSTRPLQPNRDTGLMNFSHFSRPAALVKANLQSIVGAAGSHGGGGLRSSRKVSVASSNPTEPSVIEYTGGKNLAGSLHQPVPFAGKVDLRPPNKHSLELNSVEQSETICPEEASRNNRSPDQAMSSSFAASVALGRQESEKAFEPVVASSSVCSGNSAGGASYEHKFGLKRKSREHEESEYQSEDVEDESADVRKPIKATKRSRAAEVHNLSERRRRDRINEKMRALQELIPNCNKSKICLPQNDTSDEALSLGGFITNKMLGILLVDKASMLDEAIEYLKTLQLQVQIMSMGNGLCMPPMMLPAGMQHMRPPPMPHYPPIGIGVGMGMGFGMGMLDMAGTSGCPMIPVAPIHGLQYPCSSIPGPANLHGMPAASLQMFGIHGQGLPVSMPCPPFFPVSGFQVKEACTPAVSGATAFPVPDSVPCSSTTDQTQDKIPEPKKKGSHDCPQIQAPNQVTNESFEKSDMVQQTAPTSTNLNCNGDINSTVGRNEAAPTRGSSSFKLQHVLGV
ncbi:hypothetical protein ACLOJK_015775 [Asimina triloba]